VSISELNTKLLSFCVLLIDRHSNSKKHRNEPRFFNVTSIKQTEHTATVRRFGSPMKAIPDGASTVLAELGSPHVASM
jgi:hypothetical protein